MRTEEAIQELRYPLKRRDNPQDRDKFLDAIDMALSALRAQQETERNEPLTLEELRGMDGQPVWIEFIPDADGEQLKIWALVSVDQDDGEVFLLNNLGGSSAYEEVWYDIRAIYRRPTVGEGAET